jgi:hypothetical protein
MKTVLIGTEGCSAFDVVHILEKVGHTPPAETEQQTPRWTPGPPRCKLTESAPCNPGHRPISSPSLSMEI